MPGIDGVGIMPDGTRVYTGFADGMLAEKAIVNSKRVMPIPEGIDDVTAAALPNPGLSAWFTLSYRAAIQKGDTVLILGATGITGKMAVQLAKYFGAGHVIACGRNEAVLNSLIALGADELISLSQPEAAIEKALKTAHARTPFDIVVDYLWGRPAELTLGILTGHNLNAAPHRTRYVQVGEMAGPTINLRAGILRSSAVELYGIGGGSVPMDIMKTVPTHILPTLIQLILDKKLTLETQTAPLSAISTAWQQGDTDGKRMVIVM